MSTVTSRPQASQKPSYATVNHPSCFTSKISFSTNRPQCAITRLSRSVTESNDIVLSSHFRCEVHRVLNNEVYALNYTDGSKLGERRAVGQISEVTIKQTRSVSHTDITQHLQCWYINTALCATSQISQCMGRDDGLFDRQVATLQGKSAAAILFP
jgi:hypothetical protein